MINLALRSVLHDRRRYLPVAVAVGVSGLLMVAQLGLAMGAFRLAAAPVEMSSAALWVGPPDARAIDQSRGLNPHAASRIWLEPGVARIETWREPQVVMIEMPGILDPANAQYGNLIVIDPGPAGLALSHALTPGQRAALAEPDTIAIGAADAARLALTVGDRIEIAQRPMRVVGIVPTLRGMFGITLVASEATARGVSAVSGTGPAFYLLGLRPGVDTVTVARRLEAVTPPPEYRVWTAPELSASTVRVWALESGAGTLFLASTALALGITLMVVSQTLGAAVAANQREYAALRAYGIAFRSVQGIVLRQGVYISVAALVLTGLASAGLIVALRMAQVPAAMPLPLAAGLVAVLGLVVLVSTLLAVRRLRHADPAGLLR